MGSKRSKDGLDKTIAAGFSREKNVGHWVN